DVRRLECCSRMRRKSPASTETCCRMSPTSRTRASRTWAMRRSEAPILTDWRLDSSTMMTEPRRSALFAWFVRKSSTVVAWVKPSRRRTSTAEAVGARYQAVRPEASRPLRTSVRQRVLRVLGQPDHAGIRARHVALECREVEIAEPLVEGLGEELMAAQHGVALVQAIAGAHQRPPGGTHPNGFTGAGQCALFDCLKRRQLRSGNLRALPGPDLGRGDLLELDVARLAGDDVDLIRCGRAAFLPAKCLDAGFDLRA